MAAYIYPAQCPDLNKREPRALAHLMSYFMIQLKAKANILNNEIDCLVSPNINSCVTPTNACLLLIVPLSNIYILLGLLISTFFLVKVR